MKNHNQPRDHQRQGHYQLLQAGVLAFVAGVALLFFPEFNDKLRFVAGLLLLLLGVTALTTHFVLARPADRRSSARHTDSAFGPHGPRH